MKFIIRPIVCDYAVICLDTGRVMCICNIRSNAELIADILDADNDNSYAYSYDRYPFAKYKVVKAESEDKK